MTEWIHGHPWPTFWGWCWAWTCIAAGLGAITMRASSSEDDE